MDDRVERTVATYEDVAAEYQSLHADRSDVAHIVEGFRERAVAVANETDGRPHVLDVGCGPGWEAATLRDAGLVVTGVDITWSFLTAARERVPDARFVRGDMRSLPIATGAADGVFALASLLHVPESDVDDALAEFSRVLGPDGVFTCVVKGTDRESGGSAYGEADRRHFEFYEPLQLRARLEGAGFAIDELQQEHGWILAHARLS